MVDVLLICGRKLIGNFTLPYTPRQGDNITIDQTLYKVGSTEFVYDNDSDEFEAYVTVSIRKGVSMDRPNPILGKR